MYAYIDGLVSDCSNSSALAMELLQSCTKPSIYISIFNADMTQVVEIFSCERQEPFSYI